MKGVEKEESRRRGKKWEETRATRARLATERAADSDGLVRCVFVESNLRFTLRRDVMHFKSNNLF